MKLLFVSLMLLFGTMHALEASAKNQTSIFENVTEKHLPSNITKQTESAMKQNNVSLALNTVKTVLESKSNNSREKYVDYSDFVTDVSKIISSKLAGILRKKIELLFSSKYSLNDHKKLKPFSVITKESESKLRSKNVGKPTEEVVTSDADPVADFGKKSAESRQFVFHPYLPYGKDTAPDEKISFHDVLPIKMVKFIKSMVEDAPWEAMFMKMVRMVVDQFVDKIIEQMFAHKEEDGHFRSIDDAKSSSWSLLKKSLTSVVRLRRSIDESKSEKEASGDGGSGASQLNRLSKNEEPKTKKEPENESWLDSVLEFLFPGDENEEVNEEYYQEERRKRDSEHAESTKQLSTEDIMQKLLRRFLAFSDGKPLTEEAHNIIQSSQNISESDNQLEVSTQIDAKKQTTQSKGALPERWTQLLHKDMPPGSSEFLKRTKRSDNGKEAELRLWQEGYRSRPSSPKTKNECSLRKACNAGRLLSRLPSVQDLTLQLKEYEKEPHWDALLWGMAKKRCSKIFCKRQRSPKGSKHSWSSDPEKKFLKKRTASTTHRYNAHKMHRPTFFQ